MSSSIYTESINSETYSEFYLDESFYNESFYSESSYNEILNCYMEKINLYEIPINHEQYSRLKMIWNKDIDLLKKKKLSLKVIYNLLGKHIDIKLLTKNKRF